MNTTHLKSYAPKARKDFIEAVKARAAKFGISKSETVPMEVRDEVAMVYGEAYPKQVYQQREGILELIQEKGFEPTMEAMAYTWFNRLMALRYMELHGFLDHGYRVLSHPEGDASPEILQHARHVDLPGLDPTRVTELLLAGTRDEELYRMLLLAQCHALHLAMPFLFEKVDDATELLLPDNLLHSDSLIRKIVSEVPEEDWESIEVVGWLYQFYISEKKDQVIGKVVASEDIPAATQLFTPNWIVKYMVQNSLGAQWLATYPDSPLKAQMEYYIEPAEQTPEVMEQLAKLQREWLEQQEKGLGARGQGLEKMGGHHGSVPQAPIPYSLSPEHLTLIDPASGSGHILVEAYELFKAIYLERGYQKRDIAKLILEKNLFGLDIDGRAAQLTGFALMMKGRADDRRLFERGVKLNVMALVDSTGFDAEVLAPLLRHSQSLPRHSAVSFRHSRESGNPEIPITTADLTALKDLFKHATTFGSLIQVPHDLATKLPALKQLSETTSQELFVSEALKRLGQLVQQAELLAAQYDAVVANPPYIGGKFHVPVLKKFLKDHYNGYEKDVFSAFIDRDLALSKPHGRLGFMSPFVWMFISSYEHLRTRLINKDTITSLVQLEYSGFEGATVPICTFTLQKDRANGLKGCYIRLTDFRGSENQGPRTIEAIQNRDCGWLFEAAQDEFKKIPGSPLAYWAPRDAIESFANGKPLGEIVDARIALATGDNARFVRAWPEVPLNRIGFGVASNDESVKSGAKWFPANKGGDFRKWYGNNDNLVSWLDDGADVKALVDEATGRVRSHNYNGDFGFQESVTWSALSSSRLGVRYSPPGFMFVTPGSSAFAKDGATDLKFVQALLASSVADYFLRLISATMNIEVGNILRIPFFSPPAHVADVAKSAIERTRSDWDAYERSWDFQSLPLLGVRDQGSGVSKDKTLSLIPNPLTLSKCYSIWIAKNRHTIAEMKRLEEENNRLFIDAYGLQDELTPDVPIEQITLTVNPAYRYGKGSGARDQGLEVDELGIPADLWTRFRQDTIEELVSYAMGCMMGRYRLDRPGLIYAHAGNERFLDIYERGVSLGVTYGNQELPGSDSLAEGHGTGGTGISDEQGISERRTIWAEQSDSTSGRIDSLEHCRGSCSQLDSGISQLPLDRPGVNSRSDDADADRSQAGLCHTSTSSGDPVSVGRDQQNVSRAQGQTNPSPLTPNPSPLAPNPSPLAPNPSPFAPNPSPLAPNPFPADEDGIVPLTDTQWFDDDAVIRLVEFIKVAWAPAHLEENLAFLAENLSSKKNESSRETLRRYLCDSFFKDHLQTYKKRPIYWLFSSGKHKTLQCLVYLHRYNEGTLARMRMDYCVPLLGRLGARLDSLAKDIEAAGTTAQANKLRRESELRKKQLEELRIFDEKLRHYADQRISLDLDDGVKMNYGKFGDLLAEVKAVTGTFATS